ncbi:MULTISPECIES: phosphotransferase family protein [Methylobacterium]|uniref:Phosphotransferase family protein n=1 Tax=Methylobacterium longum TaxID=767694 RepID=A0ABT8AGX5_9HYPH|nr:MULTISPECIES: phosphotransferase family protein [Methylobacterium]MCJ2100839.1 phosphotransferase family protein [Methylobacterium sp. E-046]MDN3569061.1 phosphotransferase family protein [Methylobacterium longum]
MRIWLAETLGCPDLAIADTRPLGGGSIQENRLVSCRVGDDVRAFVLRMDAAATIASSRTRAEEFRILEAVWNAGVRVPEPVAFCEDPEVIGAPFAVMGLVEGVGLGPRIAKDPSLGGDREQLAETLGRELAKIHAALDPRALPAGLAFLGAPEPDPARAEIARLRASLDGIGVRRPAIEWGLRWGEVRAPACPAPTLVHRDFRTGNYMVDGSGLTAVLDWEFAGWGDPDQDLGWFCAACWRFGRPEREAGGVGSRAAFYRGYTSESGRTVDPARVAYWEVMAHVRWAVIALEQGARHVSGREFSLELALTGRMVPDLERAILRATAPAAWS